MMRTMGAAWLVLAVGCVTPDTEPTGEVEQHGRCQGVADAEEYECEIDCTGCGHNGLREGSWNLLFGQFNRHTLKDYGMWIDPPGSPHGAKSLCHPDYVFSDHCIMRWGYSNWIAANPTSRVDIMSHTVAAIARTDYLVVDPAPDGIKYLGSFNLRPEALTQVWDYRTQETITGALLAQLNAVPGVAICLMNEQTPQNCNAAGGHYHEADFYGNHFQYYFAGISGGADAPEPWRNKRYGAIDEGAEPPARPYVHHPGGRCGYTGELGSTQHATWCLGENGTSWNYPVTARMPGNPADWFYGPLRPKPNSFPNVPVEY